MTIRYLLTGLALALTALSGPASAQATPSPAFGEWITPGGKGRVRVEPCGDKLCGTLVWLKEETAAQPLLDARNPDKALRTRPLKGVRILDRLSADGAGWAGGRGYDPERGQNFRVASLTVLPNGVLKLKGCIGPLCQTQTWTKA
jgi:uncharacterized protein (DUF2147 family)